MACLDGVWTHIDCTFDDPVGGGAENHIFFGVTNAALQDVDSHECTVLEHVATDPGCSYLYRMGNLDQRIDEVERLLVQNLDEGSLQFTIDPESFQSGNPAGLYNRLSLQVVSNSFQHKNHETEMEATSIGNEPSASVSIHFSVDDSRVLRLPTDLRVVSDEAFSGIRAEKIVFGPSTGYIAPDAFDGIDFLIFSGGNDYVKDFAQKKRFFYEQDP